MFYLPFEFIAPAEHFVLAVGGKSERSTELLTLGPTHSSALCAPTGMDGVFYEAGGFVGASLDLKSFFVVVQS